MIRVVLLGLGNVGIHLAKACINSEQIDLIQIYSRTKNHTNLLFESIPITNRIEELELADVYIIAIPDDAISEFSTQLKFKSGLVVHTSGNVPVKALKCNANKGVLYPVQTFTKNKDIDFKKIPIVFEVEEKGDLQLLEKLSKSLSDHTYNLNGDQRKYLHVAAVFVNNFSNHMCKLGYDICNENDVSFDLLKPLIMETASKVQLVSPMDAQTGPAIRNDKKVIENHLQLLNKNQKEIYTLVTNSIIDSLK
jgi:predicted short-subunit dehydrogenase-like oxidoreductase (DUF2520 family)